MPHKVTPKVFCIGETKSNRDELKNYLSSIGAENWESDANNDLSEIIEVDGRGCYLSFGTGLNDNITKVRDSNEKYIDNLLNVRHGSVLEHAFVNFQIVDVSRVFTHELVRHGPGTAKSQESLRFVRINSSDGLGYWIPGCWTQGPKIIQNFIEDIFKQHWNDCENRYHELIKASAMLETYKDQDNLFSAMINEIYIGAEHWIEDFNKLPFDIKKKYTSAARRVLPIGMATKIGWSCNIRALRHVLEMRTHPSSEEEIRYVFQEIGKIAQLRWPNLFRDYEPRLYDGYLWFETKNSKV